MSGPGSAPAGGRAGARADGHSPVAGRPLVSGRAEGPLLRLTAPISFWGGVDPVLGTIVDPRHPQHGSTISGTVLLVPSAVGSSSSSAIMLELIREKRAPAAILMGRADAILALGVVVARELGYDPIPVLELSPEALAGVPDGTRLGVDEHGRVGRLGASKGGGGGSGLV